MPQNRQAPIPKDKIRSLFIPFYTTKQNGTGLGLAISQRIVTQHSGVIEVRSTQGRGSTFSVFLPGLSPSLPGRAPTDPHGAVTQQIEGFRSEQDRLDPPASPLPTADDPASAGLSDDTSRVQ